MKTSSKLPKRNNATSGQKAHNESQFIKRFGAMCSCGNQNRMDGAQKGLCNKISPPDELGQAA